MNKPFRFIKNLLKILAGKPQVPPSLRENQLLQVILNRRSVRRFKQQDIPDDVFSAILEAGRLAPSTVNMQTWTFAVFNADLWQGIFSKPIPFKANKALIILGDVHRAKQVLDVFPSSPMVEYTVGVMNASLAAMNMNIAAEALGVSSVMLSETGRSGLLDAAYLKEKLGLPDEVLPIMTIVFGYARGNYPPMPPKLPLSQICIHGKYQNPDIAIMNTWLEQMKTGYQASHLGTSFESQLQIYRDKIGKAEDDLEAMVFINRKRAS
jgi:nitroreductase